MVHKYNKNLDKLRVLIDLKLKEKKMNKSVDIYELCLYNSICR